MKSQRIVALILGIIFIMFAIFVRAEVPEPPAGALVDQARTAAGDDRHQQSIDLYSQAIAEDSAQAAIVAYELARQYTWVEVTDSALYWFDVFLDAHPGNLDARLGRAMALNWGGRHAEADTAYLAMLEDAGDRRNEVLLGLGKVKAWQGDYPSAEKYYMQVLQTDPGDVDGQIGLAEVTNWEGKNHSATVMFEGVLSSDRTNPEATVGLAWALHWTGETGAAIRLLDQSPPANSDAAIARAAIANDRTAHGSLTWSHRDNTTDGERDLLRAVAYGWSRYNTQVGFEAAGGRLTNDAFPQIDRNEVVGTFWHQFNSTLGLMLHPGYQWNRYPSIVPPEKTQPTENFNLPIWDVYLTARRDWLRLDIGSTRTTVDVPVAIFNQTYITTENVGFDWRLNPEMITNWEVRYSDYSDGNQRFGVRQGFSWTPKWRPFSSRSNYVVLTQGLQYFNFSEVLNSGYFNPDEYIVLYGGLRLVTDLNDRTRLDVFGRLGSERELGLDWQAVTALSVALHVHAWSDLFFTAGYEHSDASVASPGGFESHVFYISADIGLRR